MIVFVFAGGLSLFLRGQVAKHGSNRNIIHHPNHRGEEASGVNATIRESTRATAIPQRQGRHRQRKTGKIATPSVVAVAIRMTMQLLTAKIAASAWWRAGALRLKLGERAGVTAYLRKWRHQRHHHRPGGGGGGRETTKPRDQEPTQDHRHHMGWGGGRGVLRPGIIHTYIHMYVFFAP